LSHVVELSIHNDEGKGSKKWAKNGDIKIDKNQQKKEIFYKIG
jgi:hypothetical protein